MLARLVPTDGFVFGAIPCSRGAALSGFVANTHVFETDTPPHLFVAAHSNLVAHCRSNHAMVEDERDGKALSLQDLPAPIASAPLIQGSSP